MTISTVALHDADVVVCYEKECTSIAPELIAFLAENSARWVVVLYESNLPLINHPQVRCYKIDQENRQIVYRQIAWQFVFLRFAYWNDDDSSIFAEIDLCRSAVHFIASEHADLGKQHIQSVFQNIDSFPLTKTIFGLQNAFYNIPAIICGAGPSLEQNASLLASLHQKALIFSGGSALKSCSDLQITPHFALHFDPSPPYERFAGHTLFETPLFYQLRLAPWVLKQHQGSRMLAPASEGYLLEKELLDGKTFDSGWVVGNFGLQMAKFLGCNPIILVGMDLCSQNQKLYAKGVDQPIDDQFVECQNLDGETCYTKKDWIFAANWMEDFASENTGSILINTARGLPLNGFAQASLEEAMRKYGKRSFDLQNLVHVRLEKGGFENIEPAKFELLESLQKCLQICQAILLVLEECYQYQKEPGAEVFLLQHDLEEEAAYQAMIAPTWNVWQHVFKREISPFSSFEFLLNQILFFQRIITAQIGCNA